VPLVIVLVLAACGAHDGSANCAGTDVRVPSAAAEPDLFGRVPGIVNQGSLQIAGRTVSVDDSTKTSAYAGAALATPTSCCVTAVRPHRWRVTTRRCGGDMSRS
jgi:hypothetical protein